LLFQIYVVVVVEPRLYDEDELEDEEEGEEEEGAEVELPPLDPAVLKRRKMIEDYGVKW